jgi:hypothetical protein
MKATPKERMMSTQTTAGARVGDWVEARGIHGETARRGQIVELLGGPGHEHFRIQWDEKHESILYPADGVVVIPQDRQLSHNKR